MSPPPPPPQPRNPHRRHQPHNKTFPDAPADVPALLYFASLLLGLAVAAAAVVLLRQYYCAGAPARPGGLRDGSSPHGDDDARAPPWFAGIGRVPGARRPRPPARSPMTTTRTPMTAAAVGRGGGSGEGGGGGGELDMAAVAPRLWGYGAMYHKPGVSGGEFQTEEREGKGDGKKTEEDPAWDCETPV